MNMFARFNENPAMTLQDIKETKRYGRTDARTDGRMDGRTDGQRENSIPPTNKVCGGYKYTKLLLTKGTFSERNEIGHWFITWQLQQHCIFSITQVLKL